MTNGSWRRVRNEDKKVYGEKRQKLPQKVRGLFVLTSGCGEMNRMLIIGFELPLGKTDTV